MKNDLYQARKRTFQYWYVDGLNEMAFGTICLLLGGIFWAQAIIPEESMLTPMLTISFVLVVVIGGLILGRLLEAIKQHLTYPRTGYVAYTRREPRRKWILGAVSALLAAIIAQLVINYAAIQNVAIAFVGFVIGAALLFVALRVRLERFYLLAAFSALAGAAVAWLKYDLTRASAVYYGLLGVALFISGGLTLIKYLRQTSPLQEQGNVR
jgi:hypothetical protein